MSDNAPAKTEQKQVNPFDELINRELVLSRAQDQYFQALIQYKNVVNKIIDNIQFVPKSQQSQSQTEKPTGE